MLETITKFESVQFILVAGLVLIVIFALASRRWRQSEELASADKRQHDLLPISQQVARHKAKDYD